MKHPEDSEGALGGPVLAGNPVADPMMAGGCQVTGTELAIGASAVTYNPNFKFLVFFYLNGKVSTYPKNFWASPNR